MFVIYPVNSGKLSEEIVDAQKIDEIIGPITIEKGQLCRVVWQDFTYRIQRHACTKKPRSHS